MTFFMFALPEANNFSNLNITIDGTIKLSKRHHHWPLTDDGDARDFFYFHDI